MYASAEYNGQESSASTEPRYLIIGIIPAIKKMELYLSSEENHWLLKK
jgi:hypothetical protein